MSDERPYLESIRKLAKDSEQSGLLDILLMTLNGTNELKEFKYYIISKYANEDKSIIEAINRFEQKINDDKEFTRNKKICE